MTCHSCAHPLPADSPLADTCADCLTNCLCFGCRESRWVIYGDQMEQQAIDAGRGN
jgi:hypothetical protein